MKIIPLALLVLILIALAPLWISLPAVMLFFFKVVAEDRKEATNLPDWKTL